MICEDNMSNTTYSDIRDDILKSCPLLFNDKQFGFECGDGWLYELKDLCYRLEFYNQLVYPHTRVRISAAQIKEKMGTLRFYYDIIVDHPYVLRKLIAFMQWLCKCVKGSVKLYNIERIVDEPIRKEKTTEEIAKECYENLQEFRNKYKDEPYITCGEELFEKDGKYFRTFNYAYPAKFHYAPTKHKCRWWFSEKIKKICDEVTAFFNKFIDYKKRDLWYSCLTAIADKEIAYTTERLEHTCEMCGSHIGYDNSRNPICQTKGWIRYVCKKCADEMDIEYINYSDKKCYKNGKLVKTVKTKRNKKRSNDE